MRKIVSMSALVSGLLAAPLLAGAKPITGDAADPTTVAEMRAHVDAVTGGEPLEAERMQVLNQRILAQVQARIDRAVAAAAVTTVAHESPLFFVDRGIVPSDDHTYQQYEDHLVLLDPNGVQVPTEKAAFLGVATSPVNALLRDQLKLQRGMGLVVDYVAPDSPALQAGMQAHDVLEKLDDQWLVNGPQFAALVRAKKPGDTVVLTIIRTGERQKITITLAEKELPLLEDQDNFRLPGFPGMAPMPYDGAANGPVGGPWQHGSRKTLFTSPDGTVTRTLKDGVHDITLTTSPQNETRLLIKDLAGHALYAALYMTDADKAAVPADCAKAVEELAAITPPATGAPAARQQSAATLVRSDAEQQIVLKVEGSEKSLRVKDVQSGKILFEGPVNTDEEVAALPPGVAEKMKWMEQKLDAGK